MLCSTGPNEPPNPAFYIVPIIAVVLVVVVVVVFFFFFLLFFEGRIGVCGNAPPSFWAAVIWMTFNENRFSDSDPST